MIAISNIIIYNCGEEFFEHYHVKQMFHTNCTELGKGTVGQYKMHAHIKYNERASTDMPMTTVVKCQVPALSRFFAMNKI
jgi:hypothetical protein